MMLPKKAQVILSAASQGFAFAAAIFSCDVPHRIIFPVCV